MLSQEQEGIERVIAYASSQLEPAHQRYCVTRRELLAAVRFTRMFRHYLLGRKFTLRTDHSSLTWLFRFKAPQGQLARWLEELSQYNFTVVHRAGKKHANADALSRLDVDDPTHATVTGLVRSSRVYPVKDVPIAPRCMSNGRGSTPMWTT